jgi:hypothetical protein
MTWWDHPLNAPCQVRDLGYLKITEDGGQDKCQAAVISAPWVARTVPNGPRELIEQACGNGSILLTGARVTSLIIGGNRIAGVQFRMAVACIMSAPW